MQVDDKAYNETVLTTFATYKTEAAAVMFAMALAEEKGWDVDCTIRAVNLAFLSGGRSGKPRDDRTFRTTVTELRQHCRGEHTANETLYSFNKTPLQKRISGGE